MNDQALTRVEQLERDLSNSRERRKVHEKTITVLVWVIIAIVAFAFYKRAWPEPYWEPDLEENQILFKRESLLHKTDITPVAWKEYDPGHWGWCAKGKDGDWYLFWHENYLSDGGSDY